MQTGLSGAPLPSEQRPDPQDAHGPCLAQRTAPLSPFWTLHMSFPCLKPTPRCLSLERWQAWVTCDVPPSAGWGCTGSVRQSLSSKQVARPHSPLPLLPFPLPIKLLPEGCYGARHSPSASASEAGGHLGLNVLLEHKCVCRGVSIPLLLPGWVQLQPPILQSCSVCLPLAEDRAAVHLPSIQNSHGSLCHQLGGFGLCGLLYKGTHHLAPLPCPHTAQRHRLGPEQLPRCAR